MYSYSFLTLFGFHGQMKLAILILGKYMIIPDLLKEAVNLSAWMHQSCKNIWVAIIKELFDNADMSSAFTSWL